MTFLKVTVTLDEDVIVTLEVTLTKGKRSPRTVFKLIGPCVRELSRSKTCDVGFVRLI